MFESIHCQLFTSCRKILGELKTTIIPVSAYDNIGNIEGHPYLKLHDC